VSARPWWEWLYARPDVLSVIRQIGAHREAFLTWYGTLSDEDRETRNHPQPLWQAYSRLHNPEGKDRRGQGGKAKEAEEERQRAAARMDDLDAANSALTEASGCRTEHQDGGAVKVLFPDPQTLIAKILEQGSDYVSEFDALWQARNG
jgi:hypothetical protein